METPKIHKSTTQNTSESDRNNRPSVTTDPSNQENNAGTNHESMKKRSRGNTIDNDTALLNRLRGNVPLDMMEATMKNMHSKAFQVDGYPMILPLESAAYLKSILGEGHSISEVDISNTGDSMVQQDVIEDKLLETHEEMSPQHLSALESFGLDGLERLMGAVLVSGKDRFRITCAEGYYRDIHIDPHAEPRSSQPSSSPTEEITTQYPGDLKITRIKDGFNNQKLVIGVRVANYLVTGGFYNDDYVLGPGRCSAFEVDHTTRIYFQKKRQNINFLENDILSLGQLRSHFGHSATFVTRRGALKGYGTLAEMPVTIFTLSLFDIPYSLVFRKLAIRAQRAVRAQQAQPGSTEEIVLHLKDIDKPKQDDETAAARLTQNLIDLFPKGQNTLVITGNNDAEAALTELANSFSNTISDRNKTSANRINRRNLPNPHLPKKHKHSH